ncbi:MAG: type IX secretion system outer membrane channel protein PorV [Capnocytophaga sp.]|nr:type IX secretion system outer membrane channel protein PorV [Capnocytophaga sp.]
MKKISLLLCLIASGAWAQNTISFGGGERLVNTAVPYTALRSDARSNALGNTSVATEADVYSQLRNASKYVFFEEDLSVAFTHTRFWNTGFDDINDNSFHLLYRRNDRSAWGGSINYYSLGKMMLKDDLGNDLRETNPYEMNVDLSYSLLLSETFSMGITGRFLNTRLEGIQNSSFGNALAFDLSGYYQSLPSEFSGFSLVKRLGFSLQNIGSKMKFNNDENEQFLPTTLRLGGGLSFTDKLNRHQFDISAEIGKYLVPEMPEYGYVDANGNGQQGANEPRIIISGDDPARTGGISGIFKGFGNASWMYSAGVGYTYNRQFSLRAGYYGESQQAGDRNFIGVGAGFKAARLGIDLSYTKSTQSIPHPLDNNMRLSLAYHFGR